MKQKQLDKFLAGLRKYLEGGEIDRFSFGRIPTYPVAFYNQGGECKECYESGGWIQEATDSIKKRGTEGVCTGDKFGSSSCPPGSKRYNLAKTFRAMAKKEFGGESQKLTIDNYLESRKALFQNKIKQNVINSIADNTADGIAEMGMTMTPFEQLQMYQDKLNELRNQQVNANQNFSDAGMNFLNSAHSYTKTKTNFASGGAMEDAIDRLNRLLSNNREQRQRVNLFPMNYHPHSVYSYQDLFDYASKNPEFKKQLENTHLQSIEQYNRLFSKNPRKTVYHFRTYNTPSTENKTTPDSMGKKPLSPSESIQFNPDNYDQNQDYFSGNPELANLTYPEQVDSSANVSPADRALYEHLYNDPRTRPYAHAVLPIKANGGPNKDGIYPYNKDGKQPYHDWSMTEKNKIGFDNQATAEWLLAGIDAATAFLNNRDSNKLNKQFKQKTLSDNLLLPDPQNRIGKLGRWGQTGMITGMMDPQNMTPIQEPGMNYGFREGGAYELTEAEIQSILANGGSVTYID